MLKFIAVLAGAALLVSSGTHEQWVFQETSIGKPVRSLTLSLTKEPAKTCISGDWKKANVISDPTHYTQEPAYTVRGETVEILLIGDMCDSYDSYIFDKGLKFPGGHVKYGMSRSTEVGKVTASLRK